MVSRSKSKKNQKPFSGLLGGFVVIIAFVAAMGIALEEMAAGEGEYRRTVWDRMTGKPAVPVGRAQVSVQLAVEICRQRVVGQLGRELLQANFDQRSSRYNTELQVHTVFLDLTLDGRERDDIYARCDVSAVNRLILEYRLQNYGNMFWG
ncbi:hypothetical protein [Saccharospirillum alexandrii]|uniref:hypothetical protein n=1 Tax=Saccharospirillum alexandrii TaxID=2448477 RepID=UPI000FD7CF30|nr:hypothetical protein [Saccharospirillum alexandrii]